MEILQIKNLTFQYPEIENKAVDNVTLNIEQGEFVVICGESGCGKSTLLKLIKKELAPYGKKSGEILYKNTELSKIDNRTSACEIGFVMQNPESQIVTDSVWHELAFGLESLGCSTSVIQRRVAEMASYFGIEEWFHKKTTELSGGQKQLLNLASVMAMNPQILLLDEPTAQLDPIAASNFIGTLQKINRESGLTILLVEHRLEEVFPISDRVLLMDKGKILYSDSPKNIGEFFSENPQHPMKSALPAAMRIFNLLGEKGDSPLTVREGRAFITKNYCNKKDTLNKTAYTHSNEKFIELKDVWFRYERDLPDVLKGVSMTIYKGEHFAVVGGNGTGKTTALGIMAGVLKAYRGKVLIKGKKLKEYKDNSLYLHNLALLPQNPQTVFLENTVEKDFAESCKTMNYKKDEAESKIQKIAHKLSISHLLQIHPYDLSGGEQQKVALAKVLLTEPEILLLDEPTKGIDAYSKLTLSEISKQLKNEGITVITVTHDVEFAATNADRCSMLFDGELVSASTPAEFFCENSFYTTAANRISRGYYKNAVLCEDVASLCKINGKKGVNTDA